MTSPRMINADLYLQDDDSWTLALEHIQDIQEAFVGYMELGLGFEDVMQHMGSEEEFFFADTERVKDATCAMCAVAICIPHPRINDLVGYIADIGADCVDEIKYGLETLFEYNLGRKMMVIKALDFVSMDQFSQFSPMTHEDATLIALLNDPALVKKTGSYLSKDDRQEGVLGVVYSPDRALGWVEGHPDLIPHGEVIERLRAVSKMISSGTPTTCDRQRWLDQGGVIDLGAKWCLDDVMSESFDLSVLDMPQTKRTMAMFPNECIKAIQEQMTKNSINGPLEILGTLAQTFMDAGVSGEMLFYLTCRDMSLIDYTDFKDRVDANQGEFIREAVGYTQAQWPLYRRKMTEQIVRQIPIGDLLEHCFNDRLLNAAYAIVQDKRLIASMQPTGRDQAIAGDLGL